MATVYHELMPGDAALSGSANAQYVQNPGTNFEVTGLAFDGGAADEDAFWTFSAIEYDNSSSFTVTVEWYADTASSGNVRWGVQLAAITPNTDSQDVETDGLGTAVEANDTHLGTTGQRVHSVDLTVSGASLDSVAKDDSVWLRLYREASDTVNDTMTGDAIVTRVIVKYTAA